MAHTMLSTELSCGNISSVPLRRITRGLSFLYFESLLYQMSSVVLIEVLPQSSLIFCYERSYELSKSRLLESAFYRLTLNTLFFLTRPPCYFLSSFHALKDRLLLTANFLNTSFWSTYSKEHCHSPESSLKQLFFRTHSWHIDSHMILWTR